MFLSGWDMLGRGPWPYRRQSWFGALLNVSWKWGWNWSTLVWEPSPSGLLLKSLKHSGISKAAVFGVPLNSVGMCSTKLKVSADYSKRIQNKGSMIPKQGLNDYNKVPIVSKAGHNKSRESFSLRTVWYRDGRSMYFNVVVCLAKSSNYSKWTRSASSLVRSFSRFATLRMPNSISGSKGLRE